MLSFSNKLTRILCITSYVIGIRQPKGRLYVQISSSRRHDVLFFLHLNPWVQPHQISNPGAATAQHWTVHHAWFVSHGTSGSPLLNTTLLTSGYRCGCVHGTMNNQVFTTLSLFHRWHTMNNDSIDLMTLSFLVVSLLLLQVARCLMWTT